MDRITAHIDLAPTLLEPAGLPARRGEVRRRQPEAAAAGRRHWPDRTLFFQWHRGDKPELYRAFAALSQRWKLVQPAGVWGKAQFTEAFQLFDLQADPFETTDLADKHPEVVARLKKDTRPGSRTSAPPAATIRRGSCWDSTRSRCADTPGLARPACRRGPTGLGHWEVQVAEAGDYEIKLLFAAAGEGTASLRFGQGGREDEDCEGRCGMYAGPGAPGSRGGQTRGVGGARGHQVGVHYVEVKHRP